LKVKANLREIHRWKDNIKTNFTDTKHETRTGFIILRIGCYGLDNKPLDFIKRCELLEQLSD
jgi:hypothetical protein